MKTKTNFKKTAIRSGAVVVSFVLISFTVSAQEFWKKVLTNSSFNELAIAMVEPGDRKNDAANSSTAGTEWNNFDKAFDPALELEGWMSDEGHFRLPELQHETDTQLLDVDFAGLAQSDYMTGSDEALKLEGWMFNESLWVK